VTLLASHYKFLADKERLMSSKPNSGEESSSRSLVKAISWRLVAFTVLGLVSYTFTGDWKETTLITVVYNTVQIFIYFLHERLWDRIHWGRKRGLDQLPPVDELAPPEKAAIQNRLRELGYIE
jgi:uncharacterized membrane protein